MNKKQQQGFIFLVGQKRRQRMERNRQRTAELAGHSTVVLSARESRCGVPSFLERLGRTDIRACGSCGLYHFRGAFA